MMILTSITDLTMRAAIEADRQRRGEPVAYGPFEVAFMGAGVWAGIPDELPPELVGQKIYVSTAPQPAEPVKVPSDDLRTLQNLLSWAAAQICLHEETHRGGAIWEICDQCGAKWADDEGGRPAFEWPNEITDARALLARYGAHPQLSGNSGEFDAALKTAEAYNADIPVTEQEEEEWKRLEDRK